MQDIVNGRCGWCGTDELYVKYHDQEWGNLVTSSQSFYYFYKSVKLFHFYIAPSYSLKNLSIFPL